MILEGSFLCSVQKAQGRSQLGSSQPINNELVDKIQGLEDTVLQVGSGTFRSILREQAGVSPCKTYTLVLYCLLSSSDENFLDLFSLAIFQYTIWHHWLYMHRAVHCPSRACSSSDPHCLFYLYQWHAANSCLKCYVLFWDILRVRNHIM